MSLPLRPLSTWRTALAAQDADAHASRRRTALEIGVLALLGAGTIMLTAWMARWENIVKEPRPFASVMVAQLLIWAIAALWVTWRRPPIRWSLLVIVVIALGARLAFIPQEPDVSTDVYRYVWDGRVQAEWINPYRYPPDAPELAALQDEAIYQEMNRKKRPTIYPPVAQTIFRAVYFIHPNSVTWTKLAFTLVDLVNIALIAGLLVLLGIRADRSILYAWHPLVILELGHSGHLDVITVAFLLLALLARYRQRAGWTGALLACATLTKFYAAIALPALLVRDFRRDAGTIAAFTATVFLSYLPFLGVGRRVLGYLPGYLQEEGVNSGKRFYLLLEFQERAGAWPVHWPGWLAGPLAQPVDRYKLLVVMALAGAGIWCWRKPVASRRDVPTRMLLMFSLMIILATPSYPWYSLLPLGFLPFVRGKLLILGGYLVSSSVFLYLQWWWPGRPEWARHLAYGGSAALLLAVAVLALAAVLLRQRRSSGRRGPSHAIGSLRGGETA